MAVSCMRQRLFRTGILLKGLDAVIEVASGMALLLAGPGTIQRCARWLTAGELRQDPHDRVANLLLHQAAKLSISSQHFFAIYLLAHGVVKGVAVGALLRGRLWSYPMSMAVFVGFIAYQIYRYTLTHSLMLVALSAFDLFVVWLIWLEYRAVKRGDSTLPA